MRDLAKMFGDEPHRFVRSHPIEMIEACQIHWPGIAPQSALESQIEINIEVAHRELAQRSIDRLAITTTGEVGFRDRAPMASHFKNRDHVIGVLLRLQIENERRKTEDS